MLNTEESPGLLEQDWAKLGLTVNELKPSRERGENNKLKEWEIVFNPDLIKGLETKEIELLNKYTRLSLRCWTPAYCTDAEQVMNMFRNAAVFFTSGWAANDKQWDNPESSLVEMISQNMADIPGGFAIMADAVPGFGRSELKSEHNKLENVTDDEYTEKSKLLIKLLGVVNRDRFTVVGHSAGTLPAKELAAYYQAFLLNSSAHLGESRIFWWLKQANNVGRVASYAMPGVVSTITDRLTETLTTGLPLETPSNLAQKEVWQGEQKLHQIPFWLKGDELIYQDKLAPLPYKPPRIFGTNGDKLTSFAANLNWWRASILEWRKIRGEEGGEAAVEDELKSMIIPIPEEFSSQLGHNDVLVDSRVGKVVAVEVANYLRKQHGLSEIDTVKAEIRLPSPIQLPESERLKIEERANLTHWQTYTLGGWDRSLQLLLNKQHVDGVISIPWNEVEEMKKILFAHPFILQQEGILDLQSLNRFEESLRSPDFMYGFFMKYYMSSNNQSLEGKVLRLSDIAPRFIKDFASKSENEHLVTILIGARLPQEIDLQQTLVSRIDNLRRQTALHLINASLLSLSSLPGESTNIQFGRRKSGLMICLPVIGEFFKFAQKDLSKHISEY